MAQRDSQKDIQLQRIGSKRTSRESTAVRRKVSPGLWDWLVGWNLDTTWASASKDWDTPPSEIGLHCGKYKDLTQRKASTRKRRQGYLSRSNLHHYHYYYFTPDFDNLLKGPICQMKNLTVRSSGGCGLAQRHKNDRKWFKSLSFGPTN